MVLHPTAAESTPPVTVRIFAFLSALKTEKGQHALENAFCHAAVTGQILDLVSPSHCHSH